MKQIKLRKYISSEGILKPGELIGEIILDTSGGSSVINIDNQEIKSTIEVFFEKGLTSLSGDPSGTRLVTTAKTLKPADPGFAEALIERLEQKDIRITGEIS